MYQLYILPLFLLCLKGRNSWNSQFNTADLLAGSTPKLKLNRETLPPLNRGCERDVPEVDAKSKFHEKLVFKLIQTN